MEIFQKHFKIPKLNKLIQPVWKIVTVAHQAPLSMVFPREEYWSGLPFPPPGDLPKPGIKPTSPALAGRFFTTEPLGKPLIAKYKDSNPGSFSLFVSQALFLRKVETYCSGLDHYKVALLHISEGPCASVAQSFPTLCNPMGCSPPGSSSMGFSRQGYWSGLPFPSPGDLFTLKTLAPAITLQRGAFLQY